MAEVSVGMGVGVGVPLVWSRTLGRPAARSLGLVKGEEGSEAKRRGERREGLRVRKRVRAQVDADQVEIWVAGELKVSRFRGRRRLDVGLAKGWGFCERATPSRVSNFAAHKEITGESTQRDPYHVWTAVTGRPFRRILFRETKRAASVLAAETTLRCGAGAAVGSLALESRPALAEKGLVLGNKGPGEDAADAGKRRTASGGRCEVRGGDGERIGTGVQAGGRTVRSEAAQA
ncbi:hypothetical protein HYALB_00005330 [Hymenoscyphus albidus]|uniref:Uncharacterized protein n=1 Tax=Hymenoscyphus albidus TaxID=595503 RepID=A0A9N9LWS3_9HELO|nr:hypothetical protein HYALB_00005330 [Hymenoscyphus albidus]